MTMKWKRTVLGVACLGFACTTALADNGGAYSIYDSDKDGYLDAKEYEVFRQERPRSEHGLEALKFENADSDADGRISGDEMVQLLMRVMKEKKRLAQ